MWAQRPFTALMWSGAFERHPSLKYILTEQGCRLDPREAARARVQEREPDLQALHEGPVALADASTSSATAGSARRSCRPHEGVHRHEIGVDKLMWGSDYPHLEGTWPNTMPALKDTFGEYPEAEIRAILAAMRPRSTASTRPRCSRSPSASVRPSTRSAPASARHERNDACLAGPRMGPAARRAAPRRGAGAGARPRRAARSQPGDSRQPERHGAHHRRQHDGGAGAAAHPRDGDDGRRRRRRPGCRGLGRTPRRRAAEAGDGRLGRTLGVPGRLRLRHARRHPAARRGRALLPVPSGAPRSLRPRRAAVRRDRAHPRSCGRLGLGRRSAREARRRARDRDGGLGREGGAVSRARRRRRRRLHAGRLRRSRDGRHPEPRRGTSCSTTSARR